MLWVQATRLRATLRAAPCAPPAAARPRRPAPGGGSGRRPRPSTRRRASRPAASTGLRSTAGMVLVWKLNRHCYAVARALAQKQSQGQANASMATAGKACSAARTKVEVGLGLAGRFEREEADVLVPDRHLAVRSFDCHIKQLVRQLHKHQPKVSSIREVLAAPCKRAVHLTLCRADMPSQERQSFIATASVWVLPV